MTPPRTVFGVARRTRTRQWDIDTGVVTFESDPSSPDEILISINGVPSSHLDLNDPSQLMFEYMQWIAQVIDRLPRSTKPLRVLHLGGAGCSLACHIEATRPNSRQVVVEIDQRLAQLVREELPLPRSPKMRIRVGEAREVTSALRPASFDVIIRDVFFESAVPGHLRTMEFMEQVSAALNDDGVYLANAASRAPFITLRSELASMSRVFPHVAMILDPTCMSGPRRGNEVLIGVKTPTVFDELNQDRIDLDRSLRTLSPPASCLRGDVLTRFIGSAPPLCD